MSHTNTHTAGAPVVLVSSSPSLRPRVAKQNAGQPRNRTTFRFRVRISPSLTSKLISRSSKSSRTQIYFCCKCRSFLRFWGTKTSMLWCCEHKAMCECISYITMHSPTLFSTDAVVLWDWIISLPREWQYVGSFTLHVYKASKTVHCRSGRHLGHQSKQRTCFAGTNAWALLYLDSTFAVTGSSRLCLTCFTPS